MSSQTVFIVRLIPVYQVHNVIGGFYKGSRIKKEAIGQILGWEENTIMFLEENRNAAIEKFISKERMKEKIAKEKLDIVQERIACLENLK